MMMRKSQLTIKKSWEKNLISAVRSLALNRKKEISEFLCLCPLLWLQLGVESDLKGSGA